MNYGELLADMLEETGLGLEMEAQDAAALIVEQGALLAAAAEEPGFEMVLRAARNNVALQLGISASQVTRAAEGQVLGFIQTALMGLAVDG